MKTRFFQVALYSVGLHGSLKQEEVRTLSGSFLNLTSDSQYVYVAYQGPDGSASTGLLVFDTTGGTLSPISGSPYNLNFDGCSPQFYGICSIGVTGLLATGNRLFVGEVVTRDSGTVAVCERTSGGGLTHPSPFAPAQVGSLTAAPDSRVVYVTDDSNSGFTYGYVLDLTDHLISQNFSNITPNDILVSPDGKYLFASAAPYNSDSAILVFSIDPSTGMLTGTPGSPFSTGEPGARIMAMDPNGKFLLVEHDINVPTSVHKLVIMSYDPSTGALTKAGEADIGKGVNSIAAGTF